MRIEYTFSMHNKIMNRLDRYILNTIFDYLELNEIGRLQITNKNLYQNVYEYQKILIEKLLNNKFFTNEVRDIIIKNMDMYGNYHSNSEILGKLNTKSITYLIKNKNPIIQLYKLYYNTFSNEYNYTLNIDTNINTSFHNRTDILYYGGELVVITVNNIIMCYNFLTSKWKKYYIQNSSSRITSTMKYVIHDNKLYVLYDYLVDEINTFEPYPLGIIIFLDDDSFTIDFFDNKSIFNRSFSNYSLISYENKIWKVGGLESNYKQIKDIYTFNFENGIWEKEVFKLNNYREDLKLIDNFKLEIIDNILYAIGGDIIDSIFSIEKFDNVNRIWVMVTTYKLKYKSLFLHNNKVVLTNHEGCNVYDIKNNTWNETYINKQDDDILFKSINI
jgi:hypothetical protein